MQFLSTGKVLAALTVAGLALLIGWQQGWLQKPESETDAVATYTVQRRTLDDNVIERGTVESQNTVSGEYLAPGSSKITFIVPEGTTVAVGDRVAEFDTRELDQSIRQKEVEVNEAQGKLDEAVQALEIQINKNETDIAAARLEFDLAAIDLEKYREGTYEAERADLGRAIKEAEAELQRIREEKDNIEEMVKKGYRTPQQLRQYQLRELTFQLQVERDQQKLRVLEVYERRRQMTELEAKEKESKRKWERAQTTAVAEKLKAEAAVANARDGLEMQKEQLTELQEMRKKCLLTAEIAGSVVYANEPWMDLNDRIREGSDVYSGRTVYFIPDLTRMQVKVNAHESVVEKLREGQLATIRLDAFADRSLDGTVANVASMASSSWSSIQNFETIVRIDKIPAGVGIKPGMTAQVEIATGKYENVIAVPLGAVTEHLGQSYVYVRKANDFERRLITRGHVTHSFVEVVSGLAEGEVVALDAWQRGVADFAEAEREFQSEAPPSRPAEAQIPDEEQVPEAPATDTGLDKE
jgi:HlyD family secretion protein